MIIWYYMLFNHSLYPNFCPHHIPCVVVSIPIFVGFSFHLSTWWYKPRLDELLCKPLFFQVKPCKTSIFHRSHPFFMFKPTFLWVNTQGFPPMSQPFPTQGIPRSRHGAGGGTAPSVALGLSDGTLHFGALEPGEVQWEGAAVEIRMIRVILDWWWWLID